MTLRLLDAAESNWDRFDGWCAARNVDPWALPAHRMLSLIFFWATQYADENELRKINARLWVPPPGVVPTEGPWTAEAETAAFKSFAAAMNIKPG